MVRATDQSNYEICILEIFLISLWFINIFIEFNWIYDFYAFGNDYFHL